jgi:hypothetical protein
MTAMFHEVKDGIFIFTENAFKSNKFDAPLGLN